MSVLIDIVRVAIRIQIIRIAVFVSVIRRRFLFRSLFRRVRIKINRLSVFVDIIGLSVFINIVRVAIRIQIIRIAVFIGVIIGAIVSGGDITVQSLIFLRVIIIGRIAFVPFGILIIINVFLLIGSGIIHLFAGRVRIAVSPVVVQIITGFGSGFL